MHIRKATLGGSYPYCLGGGIREIKWECEIEAVSKREGESEGEDK